VLSRDLNTVRRGCTNPEVRKLLVTALKAGTRYRMTKNGIILYGHRGGLVACHFTMSDHRSARNVRADMRRQGLLAVA